MLGSRTQNFPDCSFVRWLVIVASGVALCLVGYGVFLTPATSHLSIAAAVTVLLAYAATGWVVIPLLSSHYPATLIVAKWAGLAAATVFAAEICLEYLFLPKNNAAWGLVEFSVVLFIYAFAGAWLAFARQNIREAILAGTLSAVVSSIIWCIFILAVFYLFWGTHRQQEVFQAEGDFDDFRRSGMSSFQRFITEDFFGATFFHLLLGPLAASILALAGGGIGKGLAVVRGRIAGNRMNSA